MKSFLKFFFSFLSLSLLSFSLSLFSQMGQFKMMLPNLADPAEGGTCDKRAPLEDFGKSQTPQSAGSGGRRGHVKNTDSGESLLG